MISRSIVLALAVGLSAPAAVAQTAAPATGTATTSPFGGLAGMLGGALPGVASTSAGNAAGVLGYCVKTNVLSGTNATTVLGRLTGKQDVAASPDYAAGQAGQLQTGSSTLSLTALKGQAKTRMCNLVLKHARSFL